MLELMTQHPVLELAFRSYLALLMALGEVGFGWLLAFRSKSMIEFIGSGKERGSRVLSQAVVICGWILLVVGCFSIAMFLVLLAVIAIQSVGS